MGNEAAYGFAADGEGPVHTVTLQRFAIAPTCVTNEQFAAFVRATVYITEAERFGWSFVFQGDLPPKLREKPGMQRAVGTEWWCRVEGARWNRPEGPGSHVKQRGAHPVVHVTWNDAQAYCAWSGQRLPTEAEWECAARGGLVQQPFPWGGELQPGGVHRMNVWQGTFPTHNTCDDGHYGPAPARSFPPNEFGLYNMTGNVWEWCWDWFDPGYYILSPSSDPVGPESGTRRCMRGGSYLCHASYCNRYRTDSRSSNTPDTSSSNIGFRCVSDL